MKAIKITTSFLLIGFIASIYFFFFTSADHYYDKAFSELTHGNYQEANRHLENVEKKYLSEWEPSYRGFLFCASEDYEKAYIEFEKTFHSLGCQANYSDEQRDETYYYLAAAAYLNKNNELFLKCHSYFKDKVTNQSFYARLNGLGYYLEKNYSKALDIWSNVPEENAVPNRQEMWRATFLESKFQHNWCNPFIAHCLIENGQFFEGRELLEKDHSSILSSSTHLYHLLVGLSYIKEADTKEIVSRIPYYKLARFYFDSDDNIDIETHFIKTTLEQHALALIQDMGQSSDEMLPYFCESIIFFIHYLEKWEPTQLALIADKIAYQLNSLITTHNYPQAKKIAQVIQDRFNEGSFRAKLAACSLQFFEEALQKDEQIFLTALWEILDHLSLPSQNVQKTVCQLLQNKIYHEIEINHCNLPKTISYLSLWSSIEKDPVLRQKFNSGLMHQAELLWRLGGLEKKATALMEICLSLSSESEKIVLIQRAKVYLTALYRLAKEANTVKRMAHIFDAMDQLHIDHQELIDSEKVANHLADAIYLFHAEHFTAAQSNAEWILKLDPANQEALRIMGLSCFYQGDYAKASDMLNLLTEPDEKSLKALALCNIFQSQCFEKELAAQIQACDLSK